SVVIRAAPLAANLGSAPSNPVIEQRERFSHTGAQTISTSADDVGFRPSASPLQLGTLVATFSVNSLPRKQAAACLSSAVHDARPHGARVETIKQVVVDSDTAKGKRMNWDIIDVPIH